MKCCVPWAPQTVTSSGTTRIETGDTRFASAASDDGTAGTINLATTTPNIKRRRRRWGRTKIM